MTVHKIFFGGNGRGGYEHHSRVADASPDLQVRYEGMLPLRHFVLPFYFDAGLNSWREYVEMEGEVKVNDTVLTHLIAKDTNIKKVVFHNKMKSGIFDPASGALQTATKVELSFVDSTGTLLPGTQAVELDLSKVGRYIIDGSALIHTDVPDDTSDDGDLFTYKEFFTESNAFVQLKLTEGTFDVACFSIMVELVDFLDVHGCTCLPKPCKVEYPEPNCPPYGINR